MKSTPVLLPRKFHGQRSLVGYSPWDHKKSNRTEQLHSNNREGTQPHPSTENWIKDLLIIAPPIRIRPTFPLSQSIPSGSFHKALILLHQRADRLKTTVTEN